MSSYGKQNLKFVFLLTQLGKEWQVLPNQLPVFIPFLKCPFILSVHCMGAYSFSLVYMPKRVAPERLVISLNW